jgi:exodeoxyribonuclease VII small subunit
VCKHFVPPRACSIIGECGGTKLVWRHHNCDYGALRFRYHRTDKNSWSFAIPSPSSKGPSPSIDELSFEVALKELEAIVAQLERGEVDLEDSIALYERGQALKTHCDKKLKSAESRLEKIVLGTSGPEGIERMETA